MSLFLNSHSQFDPDGRARPGKTRGCWIWGLLTADSDLPNSRSQKTRTSWRVEFGGLGSR